MTEISIDALYDTINELKSSNMELEDANARLKEQIKELEKENEGIQNKVWDLIDYLELKYGIDKKEVKEYWNNGGDVE